MEILHLHFQIGLLACVITLGGMSCSRENPSIESPPEADNTEILSSVTEDQLSGVGRVLIKKEGWQIPDLQQAESTKTKAKPIEGVEALVEVTRYPQVFGTVRAPADATAAIRLGLLNIQSAGEYRADGRLFAYAFTVYRLYIDKESGAITGSQGVLFHYVIYDEDGDGLFETLVPTDKTFNKTLLPRVPSWASMKKKYTSR